ncbi:MAG: type IV secretion system protein [Bacteroidales bacterium]|nr:type IV secretion system protein [Bacteroidales bacterium]
MKMTLPSILSARPAPSPRSDKAVVVLTCVLAVLLSLVGVSDAHAVPALSIDQCAPGYQPWDFTVKIVACIENSVRTATGGMIGQMTAVMLPVTGALFALAVAIAGIRIVGGEKPGRSAMYAVRLAVVSWCIHSLPALASSLLSVEAELIMAVAGGSPWGMIDNFLGNLIGFGPTLVLFQGILGIIGSALTSHSMGLMLFLAGFSAVSTLLVFVFNVVFTYLSCVIMFGFLLVISPILLPFAVFPTMYRYIEKVLYMIITVMLIPILLFAFTRLFLGIFDSLIQDIFDSVLPKGRDFRALWSINNPVFSWIMPSDTSLMDRLQAFQFMDGTSPESAVPPVQTNVNPFLRHGFNAGLANFSGLNLGPSEPIWVQTLVMRFIALGLFAAVMKNMVARIPMIASSIASSAVQMDSLWSDKTPTEMINNVQNNAQLGFGALTGGAAGGELGTGVAKAAGGNKRDQNLACQAGGVLGAIGGMMVNSRKK